MKQQEITWHGKKFGVPNSTIDKDWVLSHVLNAIYEPGWSQDLLVFKGGTCIRKCWIENYRFSEDLDFTLLDPQIEVTEKWINTILTKATKTSGALFHLNAFKKQVWKNIPQGYLIEVKFWGADHHPNQKPLPSSRWLTMIHIDINYTEQLLDQPVPKAIIHPYSDAPMTSNMVLSYSLAEILAEKIRSLQQRNRPRDIYDVEMIRRHIKPSDFDHLKSLFIQKCHSKSLKHEYPERFVNPEKQRINARHWQRGLQHQLSIESQPDFESLYSRLSMFIVQLINQK